MKSLVYLFAVFFSVFLFAQETETVTVIGEASIINNDKKLLQKTKRLMMH